MLLNSRINGGRGRKGSVQTLFSCLNKLNRETSTLAYWTNWIMDVYVVLVFTQWISLIRVSTVLERGKGGLIDQWRV